MKDEIRKYLAYDGKVSVTLATTTNLVEQARKTHDLSPTASAAFGRVLTIGSIMGKELKEEEDSITIQIRGDGLIGTIVVVANNKPVVKGYVANPYIELPLKENGKINVGGAVGKVGFLNIIKDIGLKNTFTGIVPLVSGEIAEDFTHYFATSEQKPTVVALGVLVDSSGIKAAGGYIITLMPDATNDIITKIEHTVQSVDPISKMLEENKDLSQIAKLISGDGDIKEVLKDVIPIYKCDCNKQRIEKGLLTIGKEELEEIIKKDEKAEIRCNFCSKEYIFNKEELKEIAKAIGKKQDK